jgi:hypothetical protein
VKIVVMIQIKVVPDDDLIWDNMVMHIVIAIIVTKNRFTRPSKGTWLVALLF